MTRERIGRFCIILGGLFGRPVHFDRRIPIGV